MLATANSVTEAATVYSTTALGGLMGSGVTQFFLSKCFGKKNTVIPFTSREIENYLSNSSSSDTSSGEANVSATNIEMEQLVPASQASHNRSPIYARVFKENKSASMFNSQRQSSSTHSKLPPPSPELLYDTPNPLSTIGHSA